MGKFRNVRGPPVDHMVIRITDGNDIEIPFFFLVEAEIQRYCDDRGAVARRRGGRRRFCLSGLHARRTVIWPRPPDKKERFRARRQLTACGGVFSHSAWAVNKPASREERSQRLGPESGKLARPALRGGSNGDDVPLPNLQREVASKLLFRPRIPLWLHLPTHRFGSSLCHFLHRLHRLGMVIHDVLGHGLDHLIQDSEESL